MRPRTEPIADIDTYPKKYISPIQLAMIFNINRRTVYKHIEKGALRVVRRCGVVRIHIDEARRYLSA